MKRLRNIAHPRIHRREIRRAPRCQRRIAVTDRSFQRCLIKPGGESIVNATVIPNISHVGARLVDQPVVAPGFAELVELQMKLEGFIVVAETVACMGCVAVDFLQGRGGLDLRYKGEESEHATHWDLGLGLALWGWDNTSR